MLDRAALSSGWMQRQIKADQFKDDDEEFLKQYHAKRMAEFRSNVPQKQFGSVVELNTRNFVLNVEREADNCNVIVHLYEDQIIACRVLNELLPFLANNYRHDKFFIMDVNEADPNFDVIGLPCLLVYRGGNLTHTFTRLNDEIPGWTSSSRATVRDLEEFLQIQEVLGEKTNDLEEVSDAESFGDDDFFN